MSNEIRPTMEDLLNPYVLQLLEALGKQGDLLEESNTKCEAVVEDVLRLVQALQNCKGFCVKCGATYPHREGEGRMPRCCGIVEELSG